MTLTPSTDTAADRRRFLNLGVLAHVDAGKTSLTEALLHAGGALDRVGRVDDGTTQTDTLAVERRRGITVRTAVATFRAHDVTVNLVDTPGHPDFIAEVDRSLAVLDGAVLVVSAVEGVQAQTIVLHRALRRRRVPCLIMINKIDRAGADPTRALAAIRRRLGAAVVPLGRVRDAGRRSAGVVQPDLGDPDVAEDLTAALAEHDAGLLAEWVAQGRPASPRTLAAVLGRLTRAGVVQPVLFGSARTAAGLEGLLAAVTTLLPGPAPDPGEGLSGQIFAVERTPAGDRVCAVRLRQGTVRVRDRVRVGAGLPAVVTGLEAYEPGGPVRRAGATAGQVVRLHGLAGARIGDWLGTPGAAPQPSFPAPALEATVVARDPSRSVDLHRALADLADIDPLIRLRVDAGDGTVRIRVYGRVQQEVIAETLAVGYGLEVDFRSTTVVCVETPAGPATATRRLDDPDHPYGYAIGLRVEPIPLEAGVEVVVTADRLSLPLHVYATPEGFRNAIAAYAAEPLTAGPRGWRVRGVRIVVTDSDYPSGGPTATEVRRTTVIVVAEALRRAGTRVCEPIDAFRVETPEETLPAVLGLLARHRGVARAHRIDGGIAEVSGTIPTAEVDAVRAGLPGAGHGEAVLESELDGYRGARDRGA